MAGYYDFNAIPGYAIGAGVIDQLGRITRGMGRAYLVIGDRHLSDETYERIRRSLASDPAVQEPVAENLVGRGAGLLDDLDHPAPAGEIACEVAADKIMASRAIVRFSPEEMADMVLCADRLVAGVFAG